MTFKTVEKKKLRWTWSGKNSGSSEDSTTPTIPSGKSLTSSSPIYKKIIMSHPDGGWLRCGNLSSFD